MTAPTLREAAEALLVVLEADPGIRPNAGPIRALRAALDAPVQGAAVSAEEVAAEMTRMPFDGRCLDDPQWPDYCAEVASRIAALVAERTRPVQAREIAEAVDVECERCAAYVRDADDGVPLNCLADGLLESDAAIRDRGNAPAQGSKEEWRERGQAERLAAMMGIPLEESPAQARLSLETVREIVGRDETWMDFFEAIAADWPPGVQVPWAKAWANCERMETTRLALIDTISATLWQALAADRAAEEDLRTAVEALCGALRSPRQRGAGLTDDVLTAADHVRSLLGGSRSNTIADAVRSRVDSAADDVMGGADGWIEDDDTEGT